MDEAIFLTFANVDEGRINAGQHIFNGAEIDVTNLIAALGHNQFINTFVGEHCGDSQLLGNDDLLGHGEKDGPVGARPGGNGTGAGAELGSGGGTGLPPQSGSSKQKRGLERASFQGAVLKISEPKTEGKGAACPRR